jgi:hypothetical protein
VKHVRGDVAAHVLSTDFTSVGDIMAIRNKLAMSLFLIAALIEIADFAYGYRTGRGIHWERALMGVMFASFGIYFGTRPRSAV